MESEGESEVVEKVLEEGKLLDGTPIDEKKESAITEMIEHADRAREMSRQLNELASKAEELLEEDKEHLINEISTEVMQMSYRHIMERAGLSDVVVSFESSDKTLELNHLTEEIRKMASVSDELEARILDMSNEGKIWSFIRKDSKHLASARGNIELYTEKILRDKNVDDINNIRLDWSVIGRAKDWIIFRNGKAVHDLTQEIINDLELILKSFETIQNNNVLLRKIVDDLSEGKEPDPSTLKRLKQPEIIGEHILANKHVKPTTGEWGRVFGWTPSNPSVIATILMPLVLGIFTPFVIAGIQKYKTDKALKEARTKVDGSKFKKMVSLFREVSKVMDRDEHAVFDTDSIKKQLTGDTRRIALEVAKQSTRIQGLLYEHAFLLTTHTAEVLRGIYGEWELLKGNM